MLVGCPTVELHTVVGDLGPAEVRLLGALLEKERTVPGSYPMTLNGLRSACNQTSGRDPTLSLTEGEVTAALDELRTRKLTRVIHASHGARVVKYRQVLDEVLDLTDAERAVVTLLLLRGPQTPGELRTRAERLHVFSELAEVDEALRSLADRDEPLVEELERRPGQKENRWAHRLGAAPDAQGQPGSTLGLDQAGSSSTRTESVLDRGPMARDQAVADGYDAVAPDYADHFSAELDGKPLDRWLLERLVVLADGGPVADAGCGPGHVAFHLAAAGAEVTGFDLSPAMVAAAQRRYPELAFSVADLRRLPPPAGHGGWAGIAAWYSLVHLADTELASAVGSLASTLRSGGWLGLGLHVGPEVRHVQEWWDHPVDLHFVLHDPRAVLAAVDAAGVEDVEWYRRGPQGDTEAKTERLYVLARKP